MTISANDARRRLTSLIQQVNDDCLPVEITSKVGRAVLMSADSYRSIEETAKLLRTLANARQLLESVDQAREGDRQEHELVR
jgi:antitoxin YefM